MTLFFIVYKYKTLVFSILQPSEVGVLFILVILTPPLPRPRPRSFTSVHTPPPILTGRLWWMAPNRKIYCSKSPKNYFLNNKGRLCLYLVQSTLFIYRLRICINSAPHRQILKIIEKLWINCNKLNVHVSLLILGYVCYLIRVLLKMRRCR